MFAVLRLLKIFRGFITFNSYYTNNMPEFFATNLHLLAVIEFALESLYVVALFWNLFVAIFQMCRKDCRSICFNNGNADIGSTRVNA